MKKLALALSLVLAGTALSAAPASADDRRCAGGMGPVYVDGDVIVPKGATCTLRGTRVDGNVLVRGNAVLVARGARVGGNIQLKGNGGLQVARRNVVDGDIQAFSNTGGVRAYGNRVAGNLQCKSNDPAAVGAENVVEGDRENQCRGF